MLAHEHENLAIVRLQKFQRAPPQRRPALAHAENPLHPPEQRAGVALLRFDVDRLVVILGIEDDRQIKTLRIRSRKARVLVRTPVHRRSHAVAIAEVNVVPHPDLVAVIDHRRSRHRQQQRVQQLDPPAIVVQQGREPATDAEIDPRARIRRIHPIHVVALLLGHHLERQLVVIAQEHRPLAGLRNRRRLLEDVEDRRAILHPHGHEQPRHQRKMERHVTLVAAPFAQIFHRVLRPLVGLRQEHAVAVVRIHMRAQRFQVGVRLGQVFAVRPFALVKIRNRVEPQAVHAEPQPEIQHPHDLLVHHRVIEIQIRLVRIEPMPVKRARHRVPGPVRLLEIPEDDPRVAILFVRIAPHVVIALRTAGLRPPRPLKPWMLIRGVVDHQLRDHAQRAPVRFVEERLEIVQRPVDRIHRIIVRDVVTVVAQRRRIKRQQPERGDAEILQVIQLLREPAKIPDAVSIAVVKRAHMRLVNHRVAIPPGGRRGRGRAARRNGGLREHGSPSLTVPRRPGSGSGPASHPRRSRAEKARMPRSGIPATLRHGPRPVALRTVHAAPLPF